MNGYIKLYRQILNNPVVCKDADHFAIWVYLLLNATHDHIDMLFNNQRITLNPGQLLIGRKSISRDLHIDESKVRRVLISLENDHQIDRQRSNKNSLITILKWSSYQSSDHQNEQQVTIKRPSSDHQVTTNKNVKNVKNEKNNTKNIDAFEAFAIGNPRLLQSLNSFSEMRRQIKKPLTDDAKKLLITKLIKLQQDGENIIECLDNSTLNSWQGVFPTKKVESKSGSRALDMLREEFSE
jgi:hypothetical protein